MFMKRNLPGLTVIMCQILIVGFFFMTVFNKDVNVEKHVSTVHNENLNKIADSVSILFNNEKDEVVTEEEVLDDSTNELPSLDVVKEEPKEEVIQEEKKEEKKIVTEPLVSVDASKYINRESMGFVVTEGNRQFTLNDNEFNVVVAVVSSEFDKNKDDALAVVSVILNRCDSAKWRSWSGITPYDQVIRAGQFEVYASGAYKSYMPGGSRYGSEKYNVAKQAVIDGFNGIRNNKYLGFRAWHISNYSDKYIVDGGNRYAY